MKKLVLVSLITSTQAHGIENNPTDLFYQMKKDEVIVTAEAADLILDLKVKKDSDPSYSVDHRLRRYTPTLHLGLSENWSVAVAAPYLLRESGFTDGTQTGLSNPTISFSGGWQSKGHWLGVGIDITPNAGSGSVNNDWEEAEATLTLGENFGVFSIAGNFTFATSTEETFRTQKALGIAGQFDVTPNQRLTFSRDGRFTEYTYSQVDLSISTVAYGMGKLLQESVIPSSNKKPRHLDLGRAKQGLSSQAKALVCKSAIGSKA